MVERRAWIPATRASGPVFLPASCHASQVARFNARCISTRRGASTFTAADPKYPLCKTSGLAGRDASLRFRARVGSAGARRHDAVQQRPRVAARDRFRVALNRSVWVEAPAIRSTRSVGAKSRFPTHESSWHVPGKTASYPKAPQAGERGRISGLHSRRKRRSSSQLPTRFPPPIRDRPLR